MKPSQTHVVSSTGDVSITGDNGIDSNGIDIIHPINRILSSSEENINTTLVNLVGSIPYHSWEGAINTSRSELIEGIEGANFETIRAICYRFLIQSDSYWYDTRERNYDGIISAIETRLSELGYINTEVREFFYLQNSGKRRISIPISFEKISTNTTL